MVQFGNKALKRMDANLSIHGISYSEFRVLDELSSSPGTAMPRIDLARSIGMTASGVTRLIAPMEKLGMVGKESHPRDARKSLVSLTPAGATKHEEAAATVEQVSSDFLANLTKSQRDALNRVFS